MTSRAKIILSFIAFCSIATGILSFKSQRTLSTFYKTNAQGNCFSTVQTRYTTDPAFAQDPSWSIVQSTYYTTTRVGQCPTTIIYSAF